MKTALAAVRLIVTVGHFAFEHANPKEFLTFRLFESFAMFDNFNREIFKHAFSHCVTERRSCFGVLKEELFNRLTCQHDIRFFVTPINILYIVTTAITNFLLKIPQTGGFCKRWRQEDDRLNTLDLDALDKLTRKAQKLQALVADLQPSLELVRALDGKEIVTVPTDRLIRVHEAAKILDVGQVTIGQFVKESLLTPLYVNSDQRRFWLSEVMKLPHTKP